MKVSIITPFYNTNPQYLKEYLESLSNQVFRDFSIIMVNDGSTRYNYSFLKDNPNILYLENEKNLGIPKSLNKAYSHVNSEYTVRFDSDDKFNPLLLQKEVEFLDSHPDHIGVCTDFRKFGRAIGIMRRNDDWSIENAARGVDFGFAISLMFRSSVLKEIQTDESFPVCEDFKFHIDLLRYGKIQVIHEPLYLYRKHKEQITRNTPTPELKRHFNRAVEYARGIMEERGWRKPKVSIITSIYNTPVEYVQEYLDSISQQEFQDYEIIVVNDGSKVRYPFLMKNNKVNLIENGENLGIGKSLNRAFERARGEYIVRLDSDDKFDSVLLKREVEFLDSNPDYIGVCTDMQKFGLFNKLKVRNDDWSIERASKGVDFGYGASMMFRREVLGKIKVDEELPICEDFKFHIDLMRFGKIQVIHEPLYLYRRHGEQVTRRMNKIEKRKYFMSVVRYAKSLLG